MTLNALFLDFIKEYRTRPQAQAIAERMYALPYSRLEELTGCYLPYQQAHILSRKEELQRLSLEL